MTKKRNLQKRRNMTDDEISDGELGDENEVSDFAEDANKKMTDDESVDEFDDLESEDEPDLGAEELDDDYEEFDEEEYEK